MHTIRGNGFIVVGRRHDTGLELDRGYSFSNLLPILFTWYLAKSIVHVPLWSVMYILIWLLNTLFPQTGRDNFR